jgi:hypothetical protein
MSHHHCCYVATTDSNYTIMTWYVTTGSMSDVITQQHTMHHIMVCCNNIHLLCHTNMSQHMMSHAMTQHTMS